MAACAYHSERTQRISVFPPTAKCDNDEMETEAKQPESFSKEYGLPGSFRLWIVLFPIVVFTLFTVAMSIDKTQDYAFALVKENALVDWLTWIPALVGGVLGIALAVRERRRGKESLIWLFYLIFALGLIFIAGEETSWGQNLYHYQTPGFFARYNEQGDVTLHNLDGMNGRNHFLRLGFGVGGLIGLLAWKSERFRDIAPPRALQGWFWLIALKSVLDIHFISTAGENMPSYIICELSEVIEMLVAMAGLLYVWLNARRLARLRV
jgi:hypothetical protein